MTEYVMTPYGPKPLTWTTEQAFRDARDNAKDALEDARQDYQWALDDLRYLVGRLPPNYPVPAIRPYWPDEPYFILEEVWEDLGLFDPD